MHALKSSNKTIRFRSSQIIGMLVIGMDDIDDETFQSMKTSLLKRVFDRESDVRSNAVIALSRLQDCGTPEENLVIHESLLKLLAGDPVNDVRKTVLANIELNSLTIKGILERARDIDVGVRKLVYRKIVADLPEFDTGYPLEDLVGLLSIGLNDRYI